MKTLTITAPYAKDVKDVDLFTDNTPFPKPDQEMISAIHTRILDWMIRENILVQLKLDEESVLYTSWNRDTTHPSYKIATVNFPGMLLGEDGDDNTKIEAEVSKWIMSLDNDNTTGRMIRLQELPSILVSLYGPDAINYLINVTWGGYGYLLENVPERDALIKSLHTKFPFLWIIMLMHTFMMTYVRPLDEAIPRI